MNNLKKEISEWLNLAELDLKTSEFLFKNMKPQPFEIICYHCQQSSEKYLKAFLINNNIIIKKTHDLIFLCNEALKIDNDFSKIVDECNNLNPFSTDIRYPYKIELNIEICKKALEDSNRIKEFILLKFKGINYDQ